jgi:O-acetyl-ADP-ribose deacetylase
MTVVLGDITSIDIDAIVNAANSSLMGGGGVDGAIHRAGGPLILEECRRIVAERGPLPTGQAVITTAGNLPARHVIHTVGPIWGTVDEADAVSLLGSCYLESLALAAEHDCRTIAFPNISTGVYRFPPRLAAVTAIDATTGWVRRHANLIDEVCFVCFGPENHALYQEMLGDSDASGPR